MVELRRKSGTLFSPVLAHFPHEETTRVCEINVEKGCVKLHADPGPERPKYGRVLEHERLHISPAGQSELGTN